MNKGKLNDRDDMAGEEGHAPPAQGPPDDVSEASEESFPASDPPSSTSMHAGPPDRSDAARGANQPLS